MEYLLLAKVVMVVKGIIWGGYGISAGYGVATAHRYIKDYKEAVAKDNEV